LPALIQEIKKAGSSRRLGFLTWSLPLIADRMGFKALYVTGREPLRRRSACRTQALPPIRKWSTASAHRGNDEDIHIWRWIP
jgi:hypothetical protein